jgi:hypothetical protein
VPTDLVPEQIPLDLIGEVGSRGRQRLHRRRAPRRRRRPAGSQLPSRSAARSELEGPTPVPSCVEPKEPSARPARHRSKPKLQVAAPPSHPPCFEMHDTAR